MSDAVTVETGARLHLGFRTLSPEATRVFGGLGIGLERPTVAVRATAADGVTCGHERVEGFAHRTADLLAIDGAEVVVERALPRHVGFGSGTQFALATYAAIALSAGRPPTPRRHAPALGRGYRSGVGVATFEHGGFVIDAGHPPAHLAAPPSEDGTWEIPPVEIRRDIPPSWRFLLVLPDAARGAHGRAEQAGIEDAVAAASAETAEAVERQLEDHLLPALADRDIEGFGRSLTRIDAINGDWFAAAQGARHRPPAGAIIEHLRERDIVHGVGQSSWGPLVYGLTTADHAREARRHGRVALDEIGCAGRVWVVRARNRGASAGDSDARITGADGVKPGGTMS